MAKECPLTAGLVGIITKGEGVASRTRAKGVIVQLYYKNFEYGNPIKLSLENYYELVDAKNPFKVGRKYSIDDSALPEKMYK